MKKFLSLLLVIVFCVSFCACGASSSPNGKSAIINAKSGQYYLGASTPFLLNKDNSAATVKTNSASEEELQNINTIMPRSVFDGKYLYAQENSNYTELYKYEFSDDATAKKEVWVSEATLNNSPIVTEKTTNNGYTGNIYDLQCDGDAVYFIYIPTMDYFKTECNIAYRLGKIAKDGSKIEFIGNEIASSYALKDGYIYYFDNGFTYDDGASNDYTIDYDRAGIYKMKTDGSDKQLLLGGLECPSDFPDTRNTLCSNLKIFDDYLYFIDHSASGKSRVSRMKTDGTGLDYISNDGAYNYAVDTAANKLYYSNGQYSQVVTGKRTLNEVLINEKTETTLFEFLRFTSADFSIYENYLYFIEPYQFASTGTGSFICGARYNTESGKIDYLTGEVSETTKYNDGGFVEDVVYEETYTWETHDEPM